MAREIDVESTSSREEETQIDLHGVSHVEPIGGSTQSRRIAATRCAPASSLLAQHIMRPAPTEQPAQVRHI